MIYCIFTVRKYSSILFPPPQCLTLQSLSLVTIWDVNATVYWQRALSICTAHNCDYFSLLAVGQHRRLRTQEGRGIQDILTHKQTIVHAKHKLSPKTWNSQTWRKTRGATGTSKVWRTLTSVCPAQLRHPPSCHRWYGPPVLSQARACDPGQFSALGL